jgi:hypothetical protein
MKPILTLFAVLFITTGYSADITFSNIVAEIKSQIPVQLAGGNRGGAAGDTNAVPKIPYKEEKKYLERKFGVELSNEETRAAIRSAGANPGQPHAEFLKHFGAGLLLMGDIGGDDRVKRASVDQNQIVRVEADDNYRIAFGVEAHKFYYPKQNDSFGLGPFIALQLGSNDDIVDAFAAGLMFSFRRDNADANGALNIGIGGFVDPGVQVLGDGIHENQVLPAGDTLRYKETTKFGFMVTVGFGF